VALALYRKYRPRTFAEVIGQEHVTEPLMQALRTGRLNHAYLFSGPRGCGKTSSARILARSLNCVQGPTPEPCGECDSCVALAPDGPGSIDVIEIDAASHGGVDDARDLRERAFFAPVSSRFKVYVIDEAHMVSTQGFNALLKLVEEPPDYVIFVFATTEPEKVLGTIKSRTHHYPFRLIPGGVLRPYLEHLCDREGVTVEPGVFPLVVRAGGGSARDSLSVLDQLIAGAGEEGVTYARALALLGVTDVALLDEVCDALAAGDGAAVFATIDRIAEAGHDPRRFAADLLERLRDLIVIQQVPDAAAKGLIDAPADQLVRMAAQADRFGAATLSRMADLVHDGLTEMRGTTAPRLLLELICARMLLPGADSTTGALLQRLERMERRLSATEPAAPAPVSSQPAPVSSQPAPAPPVQPAEPGPPTAGSPTPSPPEAARPQTAGPQATGVVDAVAVRRVWDEILGYLRGKSPRTAALVREATVRDVQGDTVVLLFKHTVHATMMADSSQRLLEAIHEVLGGEWQIRYEVAGQEAGGPPAGPVAPPAGARAPSAGQPSAGQPADDPNDWPTAARPGGGAPDPPQPASTASAAGSPPASKARRAPKRTAKAGAAGGRAPAPRQDGGSGTPTSRPADGYDGFDPGDEPLDEVLDEQTARRTSEQQAIELLQQALGAEKIGEAPAG
jgi:DNA polymerase III subunit gamma/tau